MNNNPNWNKDIYDEMYSKREKGESADIHHLKLLTKSDINMQRAKINYDRPAYPNYNQYLEVLEAHRNDGNAEGSGEHI